MKTYLEKNSSLILLIFMLGCNVQTFNSNSFDAITYGPKNRSATGACATEFTNMMNAMEFACIRCHAADYGYFDKQDWIDGPPTTNPAIGLVPGNAEATKLYYRLNGTGLAGGMPPSTEPQLSRDEIAHFKDFIDCLGTI